MWPSNCSRACINTKRWDEKYKDTRLKKVCITCGSEFSLVKSDEKRGRKYCSKVCIQRSVYTDKKERLLSGKDFVLSILENPESLRAVNASIARICTNWNCFELKEEIFQEWILALLSGQRMKIKFAAVLVLKAHFKNGLTGEVETMGLFSNPEIVERTAWSESRWIDACIDIGLIHPEEEIKIISLIAQGYNKDEMYKFAPKGKIEKYERLFSGVKTEDLFDLIA